MSERPSGFVPLDVPPGVPIARPVMAAPAAYARLFDDAPPLVRKEVGRLGAILELLALIPAGLLGSIIAFVLFHTVLKSVALRDIRWYYLGATVSGALCVTSVCFLMVRIDGQRPASIGWTLREFWSNVGLGLAAFVGSYVAMTVLAIVVLVLFPGLLPERSQAQKGIEESLPPVRALYFLPLMLFVAVWEEFVFRGFLLSRLKVILNSWWVVIPVGAVIFGSAHLYQGTMAVGLVMVMGIFLGLLLIWRKSLVPGIVFHLAHNLVMLQLLRTISTNWR
jgi:membrane protease YdiL (CAAX protease family)